ncbi:MAG: redox-regulated ATPase YchF [Acidilobaceae archaeon]
MEATSALLGIVGKTNVGKSTFFSAATLIEVPIENRPFVTIDPNVGVAYAKKRCAHIELGLPFCNALNSVCLNGWRMIPVKVVDVAGLVPGAHKGRGLGNMFLDHLRRADGLLLVVDASGSTDEEGRFVGPGRYDPVEEVSAMIREIDEWIYGIISKDWERLARHIDVAGAIDVAGSLAQRLSGLSVTKRHVAEALEASGLANKKLSSWSSEDLKRFVVELRKLSKPLVIVANKADIPEAEENLKRLKETFKEVPVIPTSAIAELILRKAVAKGVVKYVPGEPDFEVMGPVDAKSLRVLETIRESVLKKWGSTGVQEAINVLVFGQLKMITVYPVEDPLKLTDRSGRVLPDVLLVPDGTTARELAYKIHTDLGESFLYAVNAKTKQRVGENYKLKDGDVIKIVATRAKKT